MFKKYVYSAVLASLLFSVSAANAALIVDTGIPDMSSSFVVDSNDWIAGQIHLNQASTINSIFAYLSNQSFGDGSFNLSLYDQSASKPTGDSIYTVAVNYNSSDAAWVGANNLNWQASAGDYWVGVEVQDGQSNFLASVNAPNPLAHTAYTDGSNHNSYIRYDGMNFGLQVDAVSAVAAVPEPESYAMLLAGLGLMGFMVRRRKS